MKKSKKFTSVVLAIVLVFTMIPFSSFAGILSYDKYASLKTGTGYIAIGDSFTRGYGATEDYADFICLNELKEDSQQITYSNIKTLYCRNVQGSYPNYVAKALGLYSPNKITDNKAQYWPIAHNDLAVHYMLSLLGVAGYDGYYGGSDGELMRPRYNADLLLYGLSGKSFSFGIYNSTYFATDNPVIPIDNLIKNAGLISIGLGQEEVLLSNVNDILTVVDSIKEGDSGKIAGSVTGFINKLYASFYSFKADYTKLINIIKGMAPNAKIVIVGTMNPLENVMLNDDVLLPVGAAFSIVTDLMNNFYRQIAKEKNCIYIDINNIDTPSTEEKTSASSLISAMDDESGGLDLGLQSHPNGDGYEQIGRMIVAAIDEELAKEKKISLFKPAAADTDIKVDLGQFKTVHYVMLDGKTVPLRNWVFSTGNHVLKINCNKTTAKKLTVAVLNSEKKITLMSYSLKYDRDDGYTARRTYVTHDAVGDTVTTFKTIKNALGSLGPTIEAALDKVSEMIKSLFGGISLSNS